MRFDLEKTHKIFALNFKTLLITSSIIHVHNGCSNTYEIVLYELKLTLIKFQQKR